MAAGRGDTNRNVEPGVKRHEADSLHSLSFSQVGSRALVLSPTRELALQTYRFAKVRIDHERRCRIRTDNMTTKRSWTCGSYPFSPSSLPCVGPVQVHGPAHLACDWWRQVRHGSSTQNATCSVRTVSFLILLLLHSMDEQFSGVHSNPDIIIATPGRFLHLVVEMELSLSMMEYVVFDEADQCVLCEGGADKHRASKHALQGHPRSAVTLLWSF